MKTNKYSLNHEGLTNQLITEQYEVIQKESLLNSTQEDLTISGSLLTQSTFKNVTFKRCVFFGCKLTECFFIGCTFEDCQFPFSHFTNCSFSSSVFRHCDWGMATLNQNYFVHCEFDYLAMHFLGKFDNTYEQCFRAFSDSKEIAA